jgi:hypothetical protein
MTTAAEDKETPANIPAARRHVLRIYEHSDLMYWWVVWLWGFICAGLTHLEGTKVDIAGHSVLVDSSPWLGISMIGLILFVVVFTNVRARGPYSLILLLFLCLAVAIAWMTKGWEEIFAVFPLLRVHANLAFYLTLSVPLFIVWVLVVFVIDRLSYWSFEPGQVGVKNVVGEGAQYYKSLNAQLTRLSDDLFVHRILGLSFLGMGTGDMELTVSPPGGQRMFTLKNIWRISKREPEMRDVLS